MKTLFLAKILNDDDRDVVRYMEFNGFECGHYFGGLHIEGACFSGFEKDLRERVENDFDSLETILTQEEFKKLFELDDKLSVLGYGIEENSDKYNEGMAILEEYHNTIEKRLLSKENEELFEKIIEDEKEYVANEWNLNSIEVDDIFNNYGLDYRDRAIVCYVYDDFDDMVENEKSNFGYDDREYFDDMAFGYDLLESENYYQLDNGKIVEYNY